ncbi:macrosialin isoform X2 [Mirounga angustirostris]|uniref:macrosialin isoform X2 n=1 Tax=Mirounga angustirostris TaxID=9716 RepID=UPI00313F0592
MGPAVVFLGALVGLLAAQGTGNDCPHKKSATLLPSFTVTPTPTATESTASPATTSHGTTTAGATSHEPTTATHRPTTATHRPTTATHRPPTTPRHGNTTIHPTTSNSTATSPAPTSSPPPGPPPPPPSPSPGPQEATGDYTWTNGSRPCVRLQARIQIGIVYPTQGGGKLSFGFKQEPRQGAVYLNYLALEYNVSFPQAAQWTFSGQNSSLRALQAPLGQSFGCRNASVLLAPALRLDLLHLKLQAAQLPPSGAFGPSFSCPSDQFNLLPLIIGLVSLGLLTLLLVTFCIVRRRPPAYQPL